MQYEYYINLNERGCFFADVRDDEGETIFEIHGFDIFEDGFMADLYDLGGLEGLLIEQGYIDKSDTLVMGDRNV